MYDFFKRYIEDDGLFYSALILLIGVASFGLGRWSMSSTPLTSTQPAAIIMNSVPETVQSASTGGPKTSSAATVQTVGKYVASKNGSKYHLPHCPGATQIKEENKIYFESEAAARAAGYTPAANCTF